MLMVVVVITVVMVVVMVMISGATTTTTAINVAVSLNAWQLRGLASEQHATAGGRAGNLSAFGVELQSAYIYFIANRAGAGFL
jgi:uncharacterized membrane protein